MKPGLKIPLLLILCLMSGTGMLAQHAGMYTPMQDDPALLRELEDANEKRYNAHISNLSGEHKNLLRKLYRGLSIVLHERYISKEILAEPVSHAYLQSLTNEITRVNPVLRDLHARIVFSRDWRPEASSTGEGTIIFNIGLFNRLRNESQAVFILCHELAHLYLKHSERSVENYGLRSANPERLYRRKGKPAHTNKKTHEELLRNMASQSRQHEMEADSLALEWMRNTDFDVRHAISTLALFDSLDRDKYDISPGFEQVFDSKEYPFQPQWVSKNDQHFLLLHKHQWHEIIDRDSLKTHPDSYTRIKQIAGRVDQYYKKDSKAFVVNEETFKKLKHDFDYEVIERCFRTGRISRSLYYSLQMLAFNRSDAYLITNIGRCLNETYKTRQANLPGDNGGPMSKSDEKYKKLLQFMNKLSLRDIAAISYFYLLVYQSEYAVHEEFLEALITSKSNFNKPEEKTYWVEQYQKKFPNGRYKF